MFVWEWNEMLIYNKKKYWKLLIIVWRLDTKGQGSQLIVVWRLDAKGQGSQLIIVWRLDTKGHNKLLAYIFMTSIYYWNVC